MFVILFKALPTKLVKCELCPGKLLEEDKLNGHLVSQHFEEVTILHNFSAKIYSYLLKRNNSVWKIHDPLSVSEHLFLLNVIH